MEKKTKSKPIFYGEIDRVAKAAPCPTCGLCGVRTHKGKHDIFSLKKGRQVRIRIRVSKHYCRACRKYFSVDVSDICPPRSIFSTASIATVQALRRAMTVESVSTFLLEHYKVSIRGSTVCDIDHMKVPTGNYRDTDWLIKHAVKIEEFHVGKRGDQVQRSASGARKKRTTRRA